MVNKVKIWTHTHTLALGILLGVSLMTACIWYAVPSRAQQVSYVSTPIPLTAFKLGGSASISQLQDGTSAVYVPNGGTFQLDFGVSPKQLQIDPLHPNQPGYAADGVYTFKFSVLNYFPVYPSYYQIEIDFGTQELCEAAGWATASLTDITLTCASPKYIIVDKALPSAGPVQGLQNLTIHGTVSEGWPLYFKNASIALTPEN